MEKCQNLTNGDKFVKIVTTQNLKLHAPSSDHNITFCIISSQSNHEHCRNSGIECKSAWAVAPTKIEIEILKPHAHRHIIGRKSTKFQMNAMKGGERVEETRFLTYRAYVSMGNNSVKTS